LQFLSAICVERSDKATTSSRRRELKMELERLEFSL